MNGIFLPKNVIKFYKLLFNYYLNQLKTPGDKR